MKVLINTPFLYLSGGVANHYLGLKTFWKEDIIYNQIGRRRFGNGVFWLLPDLLKFVFYIIWINPNIVVLNPSLAVNSFIRDSIFLRVAKLLKKKCIVFFHGWDSGYYKSIKNNSFLSRINGVDAVVVLSNEYKEKLRLLGLKIPIEITTTKVDDNLINKFDISSRDGEIKNILFLSRIEIPKGILIALKSFSLLKQRYKHLSLTVVGDGSALFEAKQFVLKEKVSDVNFTGNLDGEKLIREFQNADIYLFPTFHGEGMPTSLLEAMAFGLPIISRPVGGLKDFFIDEKMGYLVNSKNANDFVNKIELLINDPEHCKNISNYNYSYAKKHFLASHVAINLERIFIKYS